MAEDWLKWTYGLPGKREVRVIASRCKRDRHEIAGRVMSLWEWLETNLSEEDIDPATGDASLEMGEDWKAQIDDIAGLPNLAEMLASTDVRWVIPARSGGRVTFPRLGRHVGKLAKQRASEARKKARQRAEKCPDSVPSPPGPEKRRGDNINTISLSTHTLPSLEKLTAQGANAGIPPEVCQAFFDACEARPLSPDGHWTDKHGQPIAKELAALAGFARHWVANEQKGHHGKQHQGYGATSRKNHRGANDDTNGY